MIEREILGKKRGFIFGMRSIRTIGKLTGCEFVEDILIGVGNLRINGKDNVRIRSQMDHLDFICKFLYGCARHYAESQRQEVDFSADDVFDWMDEMGPTGYAEVTRGLVLTYMDQQKKAMAPMTGQTSQSDKPE